MAGNQKALIKMMKSDAELFESSEIQHTASDRVLVDDGILLDKFVAPSDANYRAEEDVNLKEFVAKKVAKKNHARKYGTSFHNTSSDGAAAA